MKNHPSHPPRSRRKSYVAAVFLGTALSAFGASHGTAADASAKTISDLSRYCTACWRNAHLPPDCWTDCTQEVFSRLMERVEPDTWTRMLSEEGEARRELIRAIDTVKKRSQRARSWSSQPIEFLADRHELRQRRLAEDREGVRQAAAEVLSQRQRHIMQLSFEGWSVHEIAAKLQLGAEHVSDEKYKAIRKLRDHLSRWEDTLA
jgi:RNA polymerase sigma factor (sigma-70 family)